MRRTLRATAVFFLCAVLALLGAGPASAVVGPPGAPSVRSSNTQLVFTSTGAGQGVTGYIANPDNPYDPSVLPYPTEDPSSGFSRQDEGFAGIINAQPPSGGDNVKMFCIDIRTNTYPGLGYALGTWDSANVPSVGLVARLLNNYYPNTDQPTGLSDNERAAAVQASIWYFTDRYVLRTQERLHDVVAGIVAAVQLAGPLLEPDPPSLTITPTSASGAAGSVVGPYAIASGSGSATVDAVGGTMYSDAAGTQRLVDGSTVATGAQIWLRSTGPVHATLTATATATVPSGNVYLYDGNGGPSDAQRLILASTATLTTHVSATANFQESGSLVVNKTIRGGAAGSQGNVRIAVNCGGAPLTDFLITGGTTGTVSRTYPNIPAGSLCTVIETVDGSTGTVTVTITGGDQQATIPPSGTATVDVDDDYEFVSGSLTVNKTIAGAAAGAQGQVVIHTVCSGTALSPDFVLAAGTPAGQSSRTYTDIPGGSVCTVTETANGATTAVSVTVTGSGGSTTVPIGGTASATITDDYEFARGSLQVVKTITGSAAGTQGQVIVHTECDGTPLTPDLVIPAGAAAGDRTQTYSGLAPGALCTVTEDPDGGSSTVVAVGTGIDHATILPGGTVTIHRTNTYLPTPGSLIVHKLISGPASGSQGIVTLHTVCDGTALSPDLTVPAGSPADDYAQQYVGIAANATCTVTETADGSSATVTVQTTGSGSSTTIPAGGSAVLTVGDHYAFALGALTVTKNIKGNAAGSQDAIIIHTECDGVALVPDLIIPPGAPPNIPVLHTYPNLAAGSVCTVTETQDGSTPLISVVVTGTGTTTIAPGATANVNITDTYQFVPTGSLLVEKNIDGQAAGSQGQIIILTDCGASGSFTFTIPAGQAAGTVSQAQPGIPVNTVCTVTETLNGSTSTVDVTVDGSPTTVTVTGQEQVVDIHDTYSYLTGSLTVTKAIAGPAAGNQGDVTIETVCGGITQPVFTIPAGTPLGSTSHTYGDLPGNARCVITETADGTTSTTVVDIEGDGQTVTVPPGGTANATITDTYSDAPGALLVGKVINGPGAGQQGPIVIEVACTGQPLVTINIKAGIPAGHGVFPITDIPAGTTCTVTETVDGHTSTVSVQVHGGTQTVDVGAGDTVVVPIVDTYSLRPGSLTVTKKIAGPAAGTQGAVIVHAVCNGVPLIPDLTVPAGAPAGSTSRTYTGLPAGLTCVVTETGTGVNLVSTVTVTGDGGRATIPAGGTAAVTVTDTFSPRPGSLLVVKTIGGPAAGQQGVVTLTVACGSAPVRTFTVPAGAAAGRSVFLVTGIPAGTACTTTETTDGATPTVVVDGAHAPHTVIVGAGRLVLVDFTNFYTQARGALLVTKTITGAGAGLQGQIELLVSCPALGAAYGWVIPANTAAGEVHRYFPRIPAGTDCTVTETESGASSTVPVEVVGSVGSATIVAHGVVTVALVNTVSQRELPNTGVPAGWLSLWGATLIGLGALLLGFGVRRRRVG